MVCRSLLTHEWIGITDFWYESDVFFLFDNINSTEMHKIIFDIYIVDTFNRWQAIYLNSGYATLPQKSRIRPFFPLFNVHSALSFTSEHPKGRENRIENPSKRPESQNNVSNPSMRCHSLWLHETEFTVGNFPFLCHKFISSLPLSRWNCMK